MITCFSFTTFVWRELSLAWFFIADVALSSNHFETLFEVIYGTTGSNKDG